MTKLTKRNLLTVAAVGVVLAVFILITAHETARRVPLDDKHRVFYEAMQKGQNRIETETRCTTCHNAESIPLPKKHPPKEQCLICHKLNYAK